MAIGFVQVDTHHRDSGHSVAAAMAYRAGLTLRDNRTGDRHDYSLRETREEVVDTGIAWSRDCPLAEHCRTLDEPEQWQHLADVIEVREKHPRARILRDVKVAIPCELNFQQKKQLARRIGEALAAYADTFVPYALHAPNSEGDERNWHTHHVLPTRALTEDGTGLGAKLRKLDLPSQSGREITHVRNIIGELLSDTLREAGIAEEVRMGQRLDEAGERDIPARVVKLARQEVRKRIGRKPRMPAREVVNLAVATGDIEPFETASPRREPRPRRTVRGTPRPEPGYRRERRSRSFRDRSIERAIETRDAALHDVLTEPARASAEHAITVATGSGGSGIATTIAPAEETPDETPGVAPDVPDAEATPKAPPGRTRRRRARKDRQESGQKGERSPRTGERRTRRRRPTRGDATTPKAETSSAPMQGEQCARAGVLDGEPTIAELERELARLEDEKRRLLKPLDLWVQERIDLARNWAVQVSTPPAKARELDVDALRHGEERGKTLEEWANPPMVANRADDYPEPKPEQPRIQAHADTDGRAPDRTPLIDAETFARERTRKREAAWHAELETKVRTHARAMGEAIIRRHAGDDGAYPTLPGAGKAARQAAVDALAPHVKPFLKRDLDGALAGWGQRFERGAQRNVAELLAAVWPAWRAEHEQMYTTARKQARADESLDESRRELRRRQEDKRAQARTTMPGTDRDPGRSR